MRKLILGSGIFFIVNIISLKAQPLKISSFTIGSKKANNKEVQAMKKKDYTGKEKDQKINCKCESEVDKEYNKILKKEIRKTKKLAKKHSRGLNTGRQKEEIGL